jgi:histidyl-tRNA synthetase
MIAPVKGTRDFYPADMAIRSWLYQTARMVTERYGYQEWEGPILESLELYAAKSGEELVKEQAFVFVDRGGDQVTLRPELTPTLARLIAQKPETFRPVRWWSFGPFWRYEQPQKGRTREFLQWNVDLIGCDTRLADAELVSIAVEFLRAIGLSSDQVQIRFNDRQLIDQALSRLEIPAEQYKAVLHLIDRVDKLSIEQWLAQGRALGLSTTQLDGLYALMNATNLWEQSPDLAAFLRYAESLGTRDWLCYDPKIVRGLDYYTGLVFEARDTHQQFRAILGGGRYANLVEAMGGEPMSAIGFAMGDKVVTLVAEKFGLLPPFGGSPAQVLVTVFSEDTLAAAATLARDLRYAGIKVELYPEVAKLPKQLKYADKQIIPIVAIIGPDELAKGSVVLKYLATRNQITTSRLAVADSVHTLLERGVGS